MLKNKKHLLMSGIPIALLLASYLLLLKGDSCKEIGDCWQFFESEPETIKRGYSFRPEMEEMVMVELSGTAIAFPFNNTQSYL